MSLDKESFKQIIIQLLNDDEEFRSLINKAFNEFFYSFIRPIEKKIDALDKKLTQVDSKIEGVQFLTKEEILTLRSDLKSYLKKG